jgi:hypothetical protein
MPAGIRQRAALLTIEQSLEKLDERNCDGRRHNHHRRESPPSSIERDGHGGRQHEREHPRVGEVEKPLGGAVAILHEPVVNRCGALADHPTQQQYRRQADRRPQANRAGQAMPRTYAAWPRCWAASSTMLTSRTLAVTGGFQFLSTTRLNSSAVTDAMYSNVTLCTAW